MSDRICSKPIVNYNMILHHVVEASSNADKAPLAYHGGRYFILNTNVVKPSHEERERIKKVIEKHKKR
jgi:hypothetical protein